MKREMEDGEDFATEITENTEENVRRKVGCAPPVGSHFSSFSVSSVAQRFLLRFSGCTRARPVRLNRDDVVFAIRDLKMKCATKVKARNNPASPKFRRFHQASLALPRLESIDCFAFQDSSPNTGQNFSRC